MANLINTAIASLGMSGMVFHCPLLANTQGFLLHTILERKTNNTPKYYPDTKLVRTYNEIIKDDDIQLVIVNTPDHLHFDMAKQALLAGKHVVVEKPFTQTTKEAEQLIELAEKNHLVLSVFQNRRWDNDFLTIKKLIQDQNLGRLVEMESHFDRYRNFIPNTWREDPSNGTGTLYNLGSHLIDQALSLFGKPLSIFADIRQFRSGAKVDDSFHIILEYNNLRVVLGANYLSKIPRPRFILYGTEGAFIKNGLDPQEQDLKSGKRPSSPDWGMDQEQNWGVIDFFLDGKNIKGKVETLKGDYTEYYNNIRDAIQNKAALIVKPEQALEVIKLIELAIESHKTGRRIVLV